MKIYTTDPDVMKRLLQTDACQVIAEYCQRDELTAMEFKADKKHLFLI